MNSHCPVHWSFWVVVAITAAMLAACSSHHGKDTQPVRMTYSPNGEPLNGGSLGHPECKDAMAGWFARVDTDHDGTLSRDEFMADARLQFPRMDIDKNGYLLSEELERFRKPYRDYSLETAGFPQEGGGKKESEGERLRHKREKPDSSDNSSGHSSHEGSSGIQADPVMSADMNNDFKVTPEEYKAQAQKVFDETDADHNGLLTQEEVLELCKQGH